MVDFELKGRPHLTDQPARRVMLEFLTSTFLQFTDTVMSECFLNVFQTSWKCWQCGCSTFL